MAFFFIYSFKFHIAGLCLGPALEKEGSEKGNEGNGTEKRKSDGREGGSQWGEW